jgi:hypothetical protein
MPLSAENRGSFETLVVIFDFSRGGLSYITTAVCEWRPYRLARAGLRRRQTGKRRIGLPFVFSSPRGMLCRRRR